MIQLSHRDIIAQELMPFKLYKDKEGNIYRKYENDEFYANIYVTMFMNAKEWMPELNVAVVHKATNKKVLGKGVYMSKRDFAEGMNRVNNGVFESKQAMFKDYVRQHQEKYQKQMPSIFKEAKIEMDEKAKQGGQEQGLIVGNGLDKLKDFIENPNLGNVELLWQDIKDKGYIRIAKRGQFKGLLIPDMKAINRIILSREFMDKPATISALIAKQASDEIIRWSRWGVSWSLNFDIGWWSDEMAKLFGIEKENYDEKNAFRKKVLGAVDYYMKYVVKLVMDFNKKITEERKQPVEEPKAELPQPNVIDMEDDND